MGVAKTDSVLTTTKYEAPLKITTRCYQRVLEETDTHTMETTQITMVTAIIVKMETKCDS